jgi:hypothetical protein
MLIFGYPDTKKGKYVYFEPDSKKDAIVKKFQKPKLISSLKMYLIIFYIFSKIGDDGMHVNQKTNRD